MIRELPETNIYTLGYLKNETVNDVTYVILDCLVPISAAVGEKRESRFFIEIGKKVILDEQIPEISLDQTRIGDMVFKNQRVLFKTALTAEEIWQIESKEDQKKLFLDWVPLSAHARIISFLAKNFPKAKTHYSLEDARDDVLRGEKKDILVKVIEIPTK